MSAKNALLFFLAVFGCIFMGLELCLPLWGMAELATPVAMIGSIMISLFLILVMGFKFILKCFYIILTAAFVSLAFESIFVSWDMVYAIVYSVVSVVLIALIPAVFLKK